MFAGGHRRQCILGILRVSPNKQYSPISKERSAPQGLQNHDAIRSARGAPPIG